MLHRVAAEAGEGHVVHVHRGEAALHAPEAGAEIVAARLFERLRPERAEVLRLGGEAAVLAEFGEG